MSSTYVRESDIALGEPLRHSRNFVPTRYIYSAYVKGINEKVDAISLWNGLNRYGSNTVRHISRTKGYAQVDFDDIASCQAALKASPHTINGIDIFLEERQPDNPYYVNSTVAASANPDDPIVRQYYEFLKRLVDEPFNKNKGLGANSTSETVRNSSVNIEQGSVSAQGQYESLLFEADDERIAKARERSERIEGGDAKVAQDYAEPEEESKFDIDEEIQARATDQSSPSALRLIFESQKHSTNYFFPESAKSSVLDRPASVGGHNLGDLPVDKAVRNVGIPGKNESTGDLDKNRTDALVPRPYEAAVNFLSDTYNLHPDPNDTGLVDAPNSISLQEHPMDPHLDGDEDNMSSIPSLTTTSTRESVISSAAVDELVKAVFEDQALKSTFDTFSACKNHIRRRVFERKLRELFKRVSTELKDEISFIVDKIAMDFLSSCTKAIARNVTSYIYSEEGRLKLEYTGLLLDRRQKVEQFIQSQLAVEPMDAAVDTKYPKRPDNNSDGEESDDGERNPHLDAKDLDSAVSFIMKSTAMINFRRKLEEFVQEIGRKGGIDYPKQLPARKVKEEVTVEGENMRNLAESALEQHFGSYLTLQVKALAGSEITFLHHDPLASVDYVKLFFEDFSGEQWNWWPFDPPRKPLPENLVRMQWRCTCGDLRSFDIPLELADECKRSLRGARLDRAVLMGLCRREDGDAFLAGEYSRKAHQQSTKNLLEGGGALWSSFKRFSDGVRSSASNAFNSMKESATALQTTPQRNKTTSSSSSTTTTTTTTTTSNTEDPERDSASRFVLLSTFKRSKIKPTQIEISPTMDDDAFFSSLRKEVRSLRGWWGWYFHPKQFYYCSFAKYTRIFVHRLIKYDSPELPICTRYRFYPRSPFDPLKPLLCPHEWYDRFHDCQPTGGHCRVVTRLPKRDAPFVLGRHDQDEDMWGLHVELRISVVMVLGWLFVLTVGGWVFFVEWMSVHGGDWQNAGVPATLVMMAVGGLFVPLSEHFNRAF